MHILCKTVTVLYQIQWHDVPDFELAPFLQLHSLRHRQNCSLGSLRGTMPLMYKLKRNAQTYIPVSRTDLFPSHRFWKTPILCRAFCKPCLSLQNHVGSFHEECLCIQKKTQIFFTLFCWFSVSDLNMFTVSKYITLMTVLYKWLWYFHNYIKTNFYINK